MSGTPRTDKLINWLTVNPVSYKNDELYLHACKLERENQELREKLLELIDACDGKPEDLVDECMQLLQRAEGRGE